MKRTPINRGSGGLSRSAPMKRSSGLAARSAKMAAKYAGPEGRRVLVERLLARHLWCQAAIERVCIGPAQDVHELLARSAGGSILDESNCICVCRPCHQWIGDHPIEAREAGLRLSRYQNRNPSTSSTKGHS